MNSEPPYLALNFSIVLALSQIVDDVVVVYEVE